MPDNRRAQVRMELHRKLLKTIDHSIFQITDEQEFRQQVRRRAEEVCRGCSDLLNTYERQSLVEEIVDETLGFGPLEQLLRDSSVNDILINGPFSVYAERDGNLQLTSIQFYNAEHLLALLQRMIARIGRRIDESSPMVDARLPDGSRINAVIPPLAIDGPLVSIRKFRNDVLQDVDLLKRGSMSADMLNFLSSCVRARANILISGGTGTGKTTLLNVLSKFVPANERIVTVEDTAELQLRQPHVARLECRPANIEGQGEVTTRDLVRNALRMRPDRIILGECRGAEAFDMVQAMNTGHSGSMGTLHANSAEDAVLRLEQLMSMAGCQLTELQLARQIAAAVQLIVHVCKDRNGCRIVSNIAEIVGVHNGQVHVKSIFHASHNPDGTSGPRIFLRSQRLPRANERVSVVAKSQPIDNAPVNGATI